MGPKKKGAKKAKKASFLMSDEDREAAEEALKKARRLKLEKERLMKIQAEELIEAQEEKKKEVRVVEYYEKLRVQDIEQSCKTYREFHQSYLKYLQFMREEREWEIYKACNHTPLPYDIRALNRFFYYWKLKEGSLDLHNVLEQLEVMYNTIKFNEEYIELELGKTTAELQNILETKFNFYQTMFEFIDRATLLAIKDVKKYYTSISIREMDFFKITDNFAIWLWGWQFGCKSKSEMPTIEITRPSREIPSFLTVTLPEILKHERNHMRIFYTSYDPFSYLCTSYDPPYYTGPKDLYEELLNLRTLKLVALKKFYLDEYDAHCMPLWFVNDEEVIADKKRKREEAMRKRRRRPKQNLDDKGDAALDSDAGTQEDWDNIDDIEEEGEDEGDFVEDIEEENIEKEDKVSVIHEEEVHEEKEEKIKKEGGDEDEDEGEEEEEEEGVEEEYGSDYSIIRTESTTEIFYSRSMADLLERRDNEFTGPKYYPELNFVEFQKRPDASEINPVIVKEYERDRIFFHSERNTHFRARVMHKKAEGGDIEVWKEETIDLNEANIFADLDDSIIKSHEIEIDENHDSLSCRVSFLEELKETVYGDKYPVHAEDASKNIEDSYTSYRLVKRNPALRSVLDLLNDFTNRNKTVQPSNDNEPKAITKEFDYFDFARSVPSKITNVTELNDLGKELDRLYVAAWGGYVDRTINELLTTNEVNAINLREYVIVGGVYHFDFLREEPQPFINKDLYRVHMHYGDFELKRIPFEKAPTVRIDFNIEAEKRASTARRITRKTMSVLKESTLMVAQPDDDLIWFTFLLPKNFIFFEPPTVVRWDETGMFWTCDAIHDVEVTENMDAVQFKLGKSVPFSLAVRKYTNLPFIYFNIKPSREWKVNPFINLTLVTQYFPITFSILRDSVTITEMTHDESHKISHLISVPMRIDQMIRQMKSHGLDLFPDWDSFLYPRTKLRKLKTLVEYMSCSIAEAAPSFEFEASSLNATSSDDEIFFSFRESRGKETENYMFHIFMMSLEETLIMDMDESDQLYEINVDPISNCPIIDLYDALHSVGSPASLKRMRRADGLTIQTLTHLLIATKVLSYS